MYQNQFRKAIRNNDINSLKNIIFQKIEIDQSIDDNYNTGLHIATKQGSVTMCKLLIEDGTANINQRQKQGQTPLHIACNNEDSEVCKILLKHKPNIDIKDNDGKTPLEIAQQKEGEILEIITNKQKYEIEDDTNETILKEPNLETIYFQKVLQITQEYEKTIENQQQQNLY